jgi:hypothetical protein
VTPVAIQPEIAKRKSVRGPVRRVPATLTYIDSDSGISFSYPRKSMLETGEKAQQDSFAHEQLPMSFVQPGGATLAVLELPSSSHQETDSRSSIFMVSVNKNLSAEQCDQFAGAGDSQKEEQKSSEIANKSIPEPVLKRSLRGAEYSELDKQTDQGAVKYYHRFVPGSSVSKSPTGDNACYEFGMTAKAEPRQENEKASLEPKADHKDVFSKLEKILVSVDIKPSAKEEMIQTAKSESKPE